MRGKVHEAPLRSVCSTPFRDVSISAQLDHGRVTLARIHVPMYYDDVSCPGTIREIPNNKVVFFCPSCSYYSPVLWKVTQPDH